jgi:hypothetical protein
MRILGIGIAIAALAGCATGTQVREAAAPTTADRAEVVACVTTELEALCYEITELVPREGQVSATRLDEPEWPLQLLGYRTTADRITVMVGPNELRVSALAADDVPEPGVTGTGVMSVGQQEAEQVVAACAR